MQGGHILGEKQSENKQQPSTYSVAMVMTVAFASKEMASFV